MPNVYHVFSPSASLFSSTQQAGWYSTGIFYNPLTQGFPRISCSSNADEEMSKVKG
jgi:hypothetical protein